MSMKNPLTPAGIEPATFRFVAQHLNHCATAVFTKYSAGNNISERVAQVPRQGKLKNIYTVVYGKFGREDFGKTGPKGEINAY